MSLVSDIVASYPSPTKVVGTKLRLVTEPQALAVLMGACLLIFVGQWPWLARSAYLDPSIELQARLGGSILAWLFVMPLALYAVSGFIFVGTRILKVPIRGVALRFVIFWGLLAATPIWLVHGAFRAFAGDIWLTDIIGIGVLATLVWVWFGGFRAAVRLDGGRA
jgi:hypothetical protein